MRPCRIKKQLSLNKLNSKFLLSGDAKDLDRRIDFKERILTKFVKIKNLKIKSNDGSLTQNELKKKSFYNHINSINNHFSNLL